MVENNYVIVESCGGIECLAKCHYKDKMPQPLGSKERTLFGQVVKNYENKQYKKGIWDTEK